MSEKAKQLRKLLSKKAEEKRNLENQQKPLIKKAASNKIDFDPLKFFEEKKKIRNRRKWDFKRYFK